MTTTVHLVRHGRTAWHEPVRFAGSSDIPLDETGRQQARRLAQWARTEPLTSLLCSDLDRARATAQAVAQVAGLEVAVDPRWREPDFGIAEGRTLAEMRVEAPEAAALFERDPAAHPWPGAEAPDDVAVRGRAAIASAVALDPGGTVLVVAHSTLIRLVVCAVLGVRLGDYRAVLPRLDPTSRTTLLVRPDGSTGLIAYNTPTGT